MAMTTIAHILGPDAHIILVNDVYGGTNRLFNKVTPNYGLKISMIPMENLETLRTTITAKTKVGLGDA